MSLETYADAADLYLTRGQDVNPRRPLFTGDVFADVPVPGIQPGGMALIIAHPCTLRGRQTQLKEHVLVAAVREYAEVGQGAWTKGYYDMMPLPHLVGRGFYLGRFDEMGRALTADLLKTQRLACLSVPGINLLQQRLIWHLTRFEVETFRLHEAFAHTFEEADLLEEWNDVLCDGGVAKTEATVLFEEFIRADQGNGRTLQEGLRDPQRRSSVRSAVRAEARRVAAQRRTSMADTESGEEDRAR